MKTSKKQTPVDDSERSRSQDRFHAIYSALRERIALLDYLPGERLSEALLAEEFGVSRTPLRAALNRLESEGLVESRHGVGTFVTVIDMEKLREVYALRRELAPLIAMLSPIPPTEELISTVDQLVDECSDIYDSDNPKQAFAKVNIKFFLALMQLIDNSALKEILELLFYRTARMWPALTTEEEIIKEAAQFTKEIYDTCELMKTGDIDAIASLQRVHLSQAFIRLEAYCKE
ncbi:GntR family transcriptional regulator [Sneathiella glossodoripedis]|uniref:GntR family transcriptional regulator n=1 Tax=Sneathiella glossodoripedis TaxID=418853 RepID=UPI00068594F2|nr:GntR family transcriptional regulator [Sneathiella glossodoripedis]